MILAAQPRRGSGVLIVLMLAILAMFAFLLMNQVSLGIVSTRSGRIEESDGIRVEYGAHAESHGAEANFARDCFKQNGTLMLFKWPHDNRYARMCQFEDGYIALQFLRHAGDKFYYEVSSYIPHLIDSSVIGVKTWLESQGWAVFTGPLP